MMGLVGLAVLGIILGAAGMEFLRASKPGMVTKAEKRVKRVIDSMLPSKRGDKSSE